MPPPTTTMSKVSVASRSNIADRSNGVSIGGACISHDSMSSPFRRSGAATVFGKCGRLLGVVFAQLVELHDMRIGSLVMRSPAELTAEFRSLGLKVTPQRQLLFRLLHGNTQHPTAEALFDLASSHMPGISLRTVYQTLTDLTAMGELQSFDFGAGATRFDPNVGTHHHLVCSTCGDVADIFADGADQLRVGDQHDFVVAATDIVFRGECGPCRDVVTAGNNPVSTRQPATRQPAIRQPATPQPATRKATRSQS